MDINYNGSELATVNTSLLKALCKVNRDLKGNTYWMTHEYDSYGLDDVRNHGMIIDANARSGGVSHRNIDDVRFGVMREGLKYKKQTIVWMVNGRYAMITGYKGATHKLDKLHKIGVTRTNLSISTENVERVIITDDLTRYVSLFPHQADRDFFLSLKAVVCDIKLTHHQ